MVKNRDKAIMIHYMIEDVVDNLIPKVTNRMTKNNNINDLWNKYDFFDDFHTELVKQRQNLLNKLSLEDYFVFAYETGYSERNTLKSDLNENEMVDIYDKKLSKPIPKAWDNCPKHPWKGETTKSLRNKSYKFVSKLVKRFWK